MRITELIPWRRFVIETRWPPDVVATELRKLVDAPGTFFGADSDRPLTGRMLDRGARFTPTIRGKNSWAPVVRVIVEPSHREGTRLRVTVHFNFFVTAFSAIWIAAFLILMIGGVLTMADQGLSILPTIAVIALFFGLFVALICGSFMRYARNSERVLREAFARAPALPEPVDTGTAYR